MIFNTKINLILLKLKNFSKKRIKIKTKMYLKNAFLQTIILMCFKLLEISTKLLKKII